MAHTLVITDASFPEEVINSELPVLVDFWAPWCGPCRMIAPMLDEMAEELNNSVKIVKINVDENPLVPSQFGVSSIPTLILFKDGQAISTKIGSLPKAKLLEWVRSAL